jgi:hypothetical protein
MILLKNIEMPTRIALVALFFTIITEHTGLWICSSDFASQPLSMDLPKRTFAMLLKHAVI